MDQNESDEDVEGYMSQSSSDDEESDESDESEGNFRSCIQEGRLPKHRKQLINMSIFTR